MISSRAQSRRRLSAARHLAPILLLIVAAPALARCDRPRPSPSEPAAAPSAGPVLPTPNPVLTRADLLAAAATAASAAAAGTRPSGPDPLAGRRFVLKIAFGCFGPDPGPPSLGIPRDGAPRWAWGPDDRSIRLSLSTDDWSRGDITGPPVEGFEAVDGVWINQPWMRREGCPAPALPIAEAAPAPAAPTLGVAMLRRTGASRLGPAGERALAFTIRGEGGRPPAPPARGYRLVIEGRLAAWANGRAIRCLAVRPTSPPACIIGAEVESLAFEDGATGETLGEWRPL